MIATRSLGKAPGNCVLPLPGAEKGSVQFPQRSKNQRISISPNGSSGTARRTPQPEAARSAERANPRWVTKAKTLPLTRQGFRLVLFSLKYSLFSIHFP